MSRAGYTGFLNATTKEEAMREAYADACEFAECNVDREENPLGGYHSSFKFYDRCFDTEEEAKEFFDSLGAYQDGVCMVKHASKSAATKYQKTIARLNDKQDALSRKAIEKFQERTSETVGCKECGTRITKFQALQRNLYCPNCGNWLAAPGIKAQWIKYAQAKELARKQYIKDIAETGKPRYWAKYEVHC